MQWPHKLSQPQEAAGQSQTTAWATLVRNRAWGFAAGWRKAEREEQQPALPQHVCHISKHLFQRMSAGASSAMPEKQTAAAVHCPDWQQPPCRACWSRDASRHPSVLGQSGGWLWGGTAHCFLPPLPQWAGCREAEQGKVLCWHAAASTATAGTWLERGASWCERRLFRHHAAAFCSLCQGPSPREIPGTKR